MRTARGESAVTRRMELTSGSCSPHPSRRASAAQLGNRRSRYRFDRFSLPQWSTTDEDSKCSCGFPGVVGLGEPIVDSGNNFRVSLIVNGKSFPNRPILEAKSPGLVLPNHVGYCSSDVVVIRESLDQQEDRKVPVKVSVRGLDD